MYRISIPNHPAVNFQTAPNTGPHLRGTLNSDIAHCVSANFEHNRIGVVWICGLGFENSVQIQFLSEPFGELVEQRDDVASIMVLSLNDEKIGGETILGHCINVPTIDQLRPRPILRDVSFSWILAKNFEKSSKKEAQTFAAEVEAKVREFEQASGLAIDELLQEEMGVGPWLPFGESPVNFSHPVSRIEAHGKFLFLMFAVPASLHNGIADFTVVSMLAHRNALLSIVRDPAPSEFGGRLFEIYRKHQDGQLQLGIGDTLIHLLAFCVTSLGMSLATLRGSVNDDLDTLRSIELRQRKVGDDLDLLEAQFGKTLAELRALQRLPKQIEKIIDQIIVWGGEGEESQIFDPSVRRRIRYLLSRVNQLEIVTDTFIADMDRAVKRGDDVSKRQLLDAQRINTFWTSALLLPNLIFAFFGQNFPGYLGETGWFWRISTASLVAYASITLVFLVRRTRRGA